MVVDEGAHSKVVNYTLPAQLDHLNVSFFVFALIVLLVYQNHALL